MTLSTDRLQALTEAVVASDDRLEAAYRDESLTERDVVSYLTAPSWYDSCGTAADGRNEHEVWLKTAELAEIAAWVNVDDLMTLECVFCGAEITRRATPKVDDDLAWRVVGAEHDDYCLWVATRAQTGT